MVLASAVSINRRRSAPSTYSITKKYEPLTTPIS